MNRDPKVKHTHLAIFGIPVSNDTLENMVEKCTAEITTSTHGKDLFHVTTISCSLISRCYALRITRVNQPEILAIARKANVTLAPSRFLKIILRLLGSATADPVTASELFLGLCHSLGLREKGIFILGGAERNTKTTAVSLHDDFHGLRLVGIATPLIFTEGEDLINSHERDVLLIEQINASNADMLVVNLGSPKQELWFERVRHHLMVPLVFTVGDALKKIGINKEIAKPSSNGDQQNDQSEPDKGIGYWIKRGFRALRDSLKITWMAFPLVIYHTINRSVFQWIYETNTSTVIPNNTQLFLSAQRSVAFITLPPLIDASNAAALQHRFDEAASHDILVFNFREVRHIQPEGFYLLINAWQRRHQHNKEIYAFCISSDLKALMKVHRTWDFFKDTICDSAESLMARISQRGELTALYDTFTQQGELVVISLLGAVDNRVDFDAYLRKLTPIIGLKDCVLDLSYCTFIDNSGFAFLLTLRKQLQSQDRRLILRSVNRTLRRQFQTADIEMLFNFS